MTRRLTVSVSQTADHNLEAKIVDKARIPKGKLRAPSNELAEEPATRTHSDVTDVNTGWKLPPDVWAAHVSAAKRLDDETARLADALLRKGIDVRAPSEITVIGAVTGCTDVLQAYRAVRFLPSVAARDRRPMLNGLKYFISKHPQANYFRFQVFTSPVPVVVGGDLRGVIQKLSRKISKWSFFLEKHFDTECLFRGIEFTRATAAERKMTDRHQADTILYHVHANVVLWPRTVLAPETWELLLKKTWRTFKAHWRDNGRLENPAEVVKYILKPGCLDGASDDEVLWLYQQTTRLKISQPLGSFATFMAELDRNREKVVRVKGTDAGKLTKVRKGTRLNHSGASRIDSSKEEQLKHTGPPPTNILLGISLPQRRYSPWSEPLILVQRYDAGAKSAADIERLQDIRTEMQWARHVWDANGGPSPAHALRVAKRYRFAGRPLLPLETGAERREAAPERAGYKVHTSRSTVLDSNAIKTDKNTCKRSPRRTPAAAAKNNNLDFSNPSPVAFEIAIRARHANPAIPFIEARLASLEQEFRKYGGIRPPTAGEILRCLSQLP